MEESIKRCEEYMQRDALHSEMIKELNKKNNSLSIRCSVMTDNNKVLKDIISLLKQHNAALKECNMLLEHEYNEMMKWNNTFKVIIFFCVTVSVVVASMVYTFS